MVVDGYGSYQYGDKATPNPDPKSQELDPIKPNQLISSVPTRRRTKPILTIEAFSCPRAHLPPPQNDRQAIVGSGVCSTLIHTRDTYKDSVWPPPPWSLATRQKNWLLYLRPLGLKSRAIPTSFFSFDPRKKKRSSRFFFAARYGSCHRAEDRPSLS